MSTFDVLSDQDEQDDRLFVGWAEAARHVGIELGNRVGGEGKARH